MPRTTTPTRRVNGEGSKPFQRPGRKGWYAQVRVTDPRTGTARRVLVSAPTKTDLAAKIRDTRTAAEKGTASAAGRAAVTVEEYVTEWCDGHLASRDVTPGTRRNYRHALTAYVVPAIGRLRMGKVRVADVEKVDARMRAAGKSKATRRQTYTAMRLMWETAVRDGIVSVNPVNEVPRPSAPPTPQPRYTVKQAHTLLDAVVGLPILEHLIPLMLWTAMRPGEALALRWDDVDLGSDPYPMAWVKATVAVDEGGRTYRQEWTKGKAPRPVPLVAGAVEALKGARAAQAAARLAVGEAWVDNGLVFADALGGLVDDRGLRRHYRPIVAGAGLTGSFQAPRRTTATLLTKAKVPLPIVSLILGHSNVSVTAAYYAVPDTDMMRDALAEFEGVMAR